MLKRILQPAFNTALSDKRPLKMTHRLFSVGDSGNAPGEADSHLAKHYEITAKTLGHAQTVLESVSRNVIDSKIEHLATKESINQMEDNITRTIKAEINQAKADFHQTQTRHMQWMFGSVALGGLGLAYRAGLFDSTQKRHGIEEKNTNNPITNAPR